MCAIPNLSGYRSPRLASFLSLYLGLVFLFDIVCTRTVIAVSSGYASRIACLLPPTGIPSPHRSSLIVNVSGPAVDRFEERYIFTTLSHTTIGS
jgi:hypothetical protein